MPDPSPDTPSVCPTCGSDIVVPTSAPAAVDLLLRLADALEADDGA